MANPQVAPSPTKVVTGEVRLSYANLFTPRPGENGGDPKYSVCILIPKSDTATVARIKAAIAAVKADPKALATWGGKALNIKEPLRDGDTERDTDEYKGMWFINASSKQKPGVVDENVQPVLDPDQVYSGCYGRVSLNFFAYANSGNKGIGAGLNNVQKLRDGERLTTRASAEDDFGPANDDNFMG